MVNPFNADAIASTVVDIVIKKQIFDFLLEVAKVGWWLLMIERTNVRRDERYQRTQMQKEAILDALRAKGLRITKQRKIILDIILGEDCSCCKEIYFQASKIDKKVRQQFIEWSILWKILGRSAAKTCIVWNATGIVLSLSPAVLNLTTILLWKYQQTNCIRLFVPVCVHVVIQKIRIYVIYVLQKNSGFHQCLSGIFKMFKKE
mgnify:CR=1 FL=1